MVEVLEVAVWWCVPRDSGGRRLSLCRWLVVARVWSQCQLGDARFSPFGASLRVRWSRSGVTGGGCEVVCARCFLGVVV